MLVQNMAVHIKLEDHQMTLSHLNRALAPLSQEAWSFLDAEAFNILQTRTGRQFVDISGPFGYTLSAVNLGTTPDSDEVDGVTVSTQNVESLKECRVDFQLTQEQLSSIDHDVMNAAMLAPLREASRKLADYEDKVIFTEIEGSIEESDRLSEPLSSDSFPTSVGVALRILKDSGVESPYALILFGEAYQNLWGKGPTVIRDIEELIDGPVLYRSFSDWDGGLLVSRSIEGNRRRGDFTLTLGLDTTIGYRTHDDDGVKLYLLQSFLFQVHRGEAAVILDGSQVVDSGNPTPT